jgi:hypothetical protein
VGAAITALQFQDMASNIIAHAQRRLRGDVAAGCPLRAAPVAADGMTPGDVELF